MAEEEGGLWRRVIVTGGAGFIGSNLTLEIQRRFPGARVLVIDDFRSGSFANLRDYRGDFLSVDVARANLEVALSPDDPSLVFHLASITDTTDADQRSMVYDNVEGFRNVLAFCLAHSTPLVYASSAATYGIAERRMDETAPARPANVYGFSKMIFDNIAREVMGIRPDFHLVGLRYFNVYGPGESHKGEMASMIYKLALQMKAGRRPRVFKHGQHKRDFVYVKDVVDATILAAACQSSGLYNVGSGAARSFNDVIAVLNKELPGALEAEYIDNPYEFYQPFTEADLSAAKKELGYSPRWSLEEGIRDYMRTLQEGNATAPSSTAPK